MASHAVQYSKAPQKINVVQFSKSTSGSTQYASSLSKTGVFSGKFKDVH